MWFAIGEWTNAFCSSDFFSASDFSFILFSSGFCKGKKVTLTPLDSFCEQSTAYSVVCSQLEWKFISFAKKILSLFALIAIGSLLNEISLFAFLLQYCWWKPFQVHENMHKESSSKIINANLIAKTCYSDFIIHKKKKKVFNHQFKWLFRCFSVLLFRIAIYSSTWRTEQVEWRS